MGSKVTTTVKVQKGSKDIVRQGFAKNMVLALVRAPLF